ncbi:MAG: DUF5106 domain-containing protein [Bacteroidales bacterium]|nr:DUF5106 domain-containing protein [Bacteroidales bacterium]
MKRTSLIIVLACTLFFLCAPNSLAAKDKKPNKGYKFTLFIYGCQDSIMYLGNYYLGGTYAFDTARISPKGMFCFEKKDVTLKPGLYFFCSPSGNYVEFAVYNNEKLSFHFDTEEPGWQSNMHVKGSKENEILFGYHQATRNIYKAIDSARNASKDSAAFELFRKKQMLRMDSVKMNYIDKNPNSLLALLMNATRDPYVPTTDSFGNKLSQREQTDYFLEHYFDHTRLDDDALLRTPELVFHKRLTTFLDTYLKYAPPETIIKYTDAIIDRSKPSKENFRYLVHTIAEKYLQSNVMVYDAIYVHIVKKYIETGMCDWMSPTTVDENVKRANTWEKILVGKQAPPLVMKDDSGQFHSLYALPNKYTLLIFWSPTCGHCKTMIPELYKKYAQYKKSCDIAAYAVLSEPDDETRPKWREFIKKHNLDWINIDGGEANIDWHEVYDIVTTPQIFLLDKDKKILAKKLSASSFEEVIKAIEKIE